MTGTEHPAPRDAAAGPALAIRTPLMAFSHVSRRTGVIRKHCIVHNATGRRVELEVCHDFPEHSWIQLVLEDSARSRPAALARSSARAGSGTLTEGRDDAARVSSDALIVPPGESSLDVLIDTDNSNFPFGSFRGVIELRPVATTEQRLASTAELEALRLSLSFEEIVDLDDFDGYAAIDLGTNGATIAVYHRQQDAGRGMTWNPGLDGKGGEGGPATDVPAAVLVRDLNGFRELTPDCCFVGRRALVEYRELTDCDPHALLIGTKRHLGRRRVLAADLLGQAGYVAPEDAIYQLGRFVREQCQNHPRIQARLPRLTVTYPPTWDQRQLDRWKDVFRRLGYRDEDLDLSLDEASAVGLFYLNLWTQDADSRDRLLQDLRDSRQEIRRDDEVGERFTLRLVCFDFGGGTIDLAHVEAELELFGDSLHIRLALLGSDSLEFGGDMVTLAVFRILKRRIAMALADPDRFVGGRAATDAAGGDAFPEPSTPGLFLLPGSGNTGTDGEVDGGAAATVRDAWDRIEGSTAAASLGRELDAAVDSLFPTRFRPDPDAPLVPRAKRNFAWLWDRAESLKCELFRAAQQRARDLALSEEAGADLRMGISLSKLPDDVVGRPLADHPAAQAQLTVGVDEIYRAIRGPLQEAVDRARRMVGSKRPDRIVLAGQSSWIPLVRQLFARPRSEGGLGLAPGKIQFDPEHAKTAVSRGACLLPVMRNALVGVSVDVSAFRVALLRDIYYRSPMGRRRELFRAGPIRDLEWTEDEPDEKTFARYLTVFSGDGDQVLGQFDFDGPGAELPDWRAGARRTARDLELDDERAFPSPQEVERLRDAEPEWTRRLSDRLANWPETELIAWMESGAKRGTKDRPVYRYYLTRSRHLLCVRDRGDSGAALYRLDYAAGAYTTLPPDQDPFAGVH